jgi:hypothetical protein
MQPFNNVVPNLISFIESQWIQRQAGKLIARQKDRNSLHKIAGFCRLIGGILLFFCVAFFRMAHYVNSSDTWWQIVSNPRTYTIIQNKVRTAPSNLWNNLAWFLVQGKTFLSVICDYLSVVGISTVYISGILGCNLLWQLWISFVSFYWWLKAIALYTSDRSFWKASPPYVFVRKRPRRAVRKLYPGLQRRKVMSISDYFHPPSHEQNKFISALRLRRWTSQFQQFEQPVLDTSHWARIASKMYLLDTLGVALQRCANGHQRQTTPLITA